MSESIIDEERTLILRGSFQFDCLHPEMGITVDLRNNGTIFFAWKDAIIREPCSTSHGIQFRIFDKAGAVLCTTTARVHRSSLLPRLRSFFAENLTEKTTSIIAHGCGGGRTQGLSLSTIPLTPASSACDDYKCEEFCMSMKEARKRLLRQEITITARHLIQLKTELESVKSSQVGEWEWGVTMEINAAKRRKE